MTTHDYIEILAILVAPLVALQVSAWIERHKEIQHRKEYVFRTLMTTRASSLAIEHIQALNMIDIVFCQKTTWITCFFFGAKKSKEKEVVEAWKNYKYHLDHTSSGDWGEKRFELLYILLKKMSDSLGYNISETDIKNTSYSPQAYVDFEEEQTIIRKAAASVLQGKTAIKISPEIKKEP